MEQLSDRRRFSRYPCPGAAEILLSGKRWGYGTVSEISRGGCYIGTINPLPTGAESAAKGLPINRRYLLSAR
jgi:hypothetical protein